MFFKELKNFSRENWWIFPLLIIATIIIWITWKGNILEIIILFFANFIANLFIMVMQWNYTAWNNKLWWIYQLTSTLIFVFISSYWLFVLEQSQYIIWQFCYLLAAIKAFSFYNFSKDFKFINPISLWILNIILLTIFIYFSQTTINILWLEIFFTASIWAIIMALWFSFVTTGLISTNDVFRYWMNVIWVSWIVLGSLILIIVWYQNWNVSWIDLWYFILTSTVLVYYLKLLPKYIK